MAQIQQFSGLGMYDEGGKFEVKQEFIDAARAKAIEEGKKYYGDATNFEVFRDGVLNLPDSAINFVARGAEGTGELFAGLASLVMKGGQLATTTDPDKLTQIMSEPSFTKYMGAFRDKIPTPNLYESDISGMEDTEKAFGTAGYYTSPVPMAPFAKGIPYLFKAGKAAKEGTENIIKDVANTLTKGDSKFRASAGGKNQFTNNPTFTTEGEKFIRDNFLKMSDNAIVDALNQNPEKFLNRIDVANKNTVTGFRDRNNLIKSAKGGADEKGAGGDFQSLTPAVILRNKNLDKITNNFKSKIGEGKIDINNPDQMYDEFSKIYRSVTGDNRPKLHTGSGHKEYFKYVDEYNKLNPEATVARSEPDLLKMKKKKYMSEQGAGISDTFDKFLTQEFMKAVRKEASTSLDPAFISNINKMRDNDSMARYLNFIRRTRTDLVDVFKDPNFKEFFSVYNPKDLNVPGSKFYKDYEKFVKLDKQRLAIGKKLNPIFKKLFPKDTKFSINIAHKFESSGIGEYVSKAKAGKGGDPSEIYLDINVINTKTQRKLEARARLLNERYYDPKKGGNREDLIELTQIDNILKGYGSEGQVVIPIKDVEGNIIMEPGFKLGQAETNIVKKIINIGENKGYNFTNKEKEILSEVLEIIDPQKFFKGGLVGIDHLTRPLRNF